MLARALRRALASRATQCHVIRHCAETSPEGAACASGWAMSENALRLITGLVVTVTGYQLYNDANEFYFSHDCRRCDGTGKLTCNKCRGYGYLKKGSDDNVKAFKQAGVDDVSNIYLCPFCKGTGTGNCADCRGKAKLWPVAVNMERLWKWRHEHGNAVERHTRREALAKDDVGRQEAKRKIQTGLGGFKMSGNANYMPYDDEQK